jgi:hypothetical protein
MGEDKAQAAGHHGNAVAQPVGETALRQELLLVLRD